VGWTEGGVQDGAGCAGRRRAGDGGAVAGGALAGGGLVAGGVLLVVVGGALVAVGQADGLPVCAGGDVGDVGVAVGVVDAAGMDGADVVAGTDPVADAEAVFADGVIVPALAGVPEGAGLIPILDTASGATSPAQYVPNGERSAKECRDERHNFAYCPNIDRREQRARGTHRNDRSPAVHFLNVSF
jgi:hypothetical protein